MTSDAADLSASRYGRRRPRRRWMTYLMAALGIGLLTAWTVWAGLAQSDKPVGWELRTYEVVSDNRVDVSFEVYTADGRPATCRIYAQAHDHSIIGELSVEVPAGPERRIVSATIATERKAVNGVVENCALSDEG